MAQRRTCVTREILALTEPLRQISDKKATPASRIEKPLFWALQYLKCNQLLQKRKSHLSSCINMWLSLFLQWYISIAEILPVVRPMACCEKCAKITKYFTDSEVPKPSRIQKYMHLQNSLPKPVVPHHHPSKIFNGQEIMYYEAKTTSITNINFHER